MPEKKYTKPLGWRSRARKKKKQRDALKGTAILFGGIFGSILAEELLNDHPIYDFLSEKYPGVFPPIDDEQPQHVDHVEVTNFIDNDHGKVVDADGTPYGGDGIKEINIDDHGEFTIEKQDGTIDKVLAKDFNEYMQEKMEKDMNIQPYEMKNPGDDVLQDGVYAYEFNIAKSNIKPLLKYLKGLGYDYIEFEDGNSGKLVVEYNVTVNAFKGEITIDGKKIAENVVIGFDENLDTFKRSILGETQDFLEDGKIGDHSYAPFLSEFVYKCKLDHTQDMLDDANQQIQDLQDDIAELEGYLSDADAEADEYRPGDWQDLDDRIRDLRNELTNATDYIDELKGYLNDADTEADQYREGDWEDLDDRIKDLIEERDDLQDDLDGLEDYVDSLDDKYTQYWHIPKDLFGMVYDKLMADGNLNETEKIFLGSLFIPEFMDDDPENDELKEMVVQIQPSKEYSLIYINTDIGSNITTNHTRGLAEKIVKTAYDLKGQDVDHHYGFTPEYLEGLDHENFVAAWEVAKKKHWYKRINRMDDNGELNESGSMDFYNLHEKEGVTDLDWFYDQWENGMIKYVEIVDTGDDEKNGGYAAAYDMNNKLLRRTPIKIENIEKTREYFQG
ncbi:MAG: hypothetical protein ACE5J7_02250 [Candidatus Aenigmatarchaeota archaeon]